MKINELPAPKKIAVWAAIAFFGSAAVVGAIQRLVTSSSLETAPQPAVTTKQTEETEPYSNVTEPEEEMRSETQPEDTSETTVNQSANEEQEPATQPTQPQPSPTQPTPQPEPAQPATTPAPEPAPQPVSTPAPSATTQSELPEEDSNLPLKATCGDGTIQYQDDPSLPNYRGMCSGHDGVAIRHGRVP